MPGLRGASIGSGVAEFIGAAIAFPSSDTIHCTQKNSSAAASVAKRVRGHPGLLAEKSGKMRGVGKSQIVGDFMDRLVREDELTLGFGQDTLTDQMTCRYSR